MKIDYDVGDVVVCVQCSPQMLSYGMKNGAMHRVASIFQHKGQIGVTFSTISSGIYPGWKAERFRKLAKADDDFTEYMRSMKPHKQGVDA